MSTKKLIILLIPLLVILIALGGVLVLLPGKSNVYYEELSTARKLSQSGDFNQAVVYYTKAISEDNKQVDAYLELAKVYFENLNQPAKALQILSSGILATNSNELKISYDNYLAQNSGTTPVEQVTKEGTNYKITFNDEIINTFAMFTFEKYTQNCTEVSPNCNNGLYTVRYQQFNATFEYKNSVENPALVNTTEGKPYANSRPSAIIIDDISSIINFVDGSASLKTLEEMGASNVALGTYDNELKSKTVSLSYDSCKLVITCDDNGTITTKSTCRIIPTQSAGAKKVNVSGSIIDVTTKDPITKSAILTFREGKDNESGNVSETCESSDGTYTVDLAPADYTVEIKADGYTTEYFDLYVADTNGSITQDFSISPELGADEIRIVLEWNSAPRDLDSHLEGQTSGGTDIHVYFENPSAFEDGDDVAKLDVDERDGYGPETITLSKTAGSYHYYVYRFSSDSSIGESGCTVKIYEGNSSSPKVITPPDDVDDIQWDVCDINNGKVENINGSY
ncbi:MAG: tetratricopeptide repeat protein [Ruminococcus sp.]|nr:tetratricopeptide repeat protein [Ruminococcus sp.]